MDEVQFLLEIPRPPQGQECIIVDIVSHGKPPDPDAATTSDEDDDSHSDAVVPVIPCEAVSIPTPITQPGPSIPITSNKSSVLESDMHTRSSRSKLTSRITPQETVNAEHVRPATPDIVTISDGEMDETPDDFVTPVEEKTTSDEAISSPAQTLQTCPSPSTSGNTDEDSTPVLPPIISETASSGASTAVVYKQSKPRCWATFLKETGNAESVAPVNLFKHAPFANDWEDFARPGLLLEVKNHFVEPEEDNTAYWIAWVKRFSGYWAEIEFERFDLTLKSTFWIPFCSDIPRYFGYANDHDDTTIRPDSEIANKYPNFTEKVMEKLLKLDSLKTVQEGHGKMVSEELKSKQIYRLGTKLEVQDVKFLDKTQVGEVTAVVGDRIHITYGLPQRAAKYDYGVFLNVKSEFIHPLGWSHTVGHDLRLNESDEDRNVVLRCSQLISIDNSLSSYKVSVEEGMILEMRNPETLYQIVPAFVSKVLKFGYFLAKYKGLDTNGRVKSFKICQHVSSPYILQCGFAQSNNIPIAYPPVSAFKSPDWEIYCLVSKRKPLDLTNLPKKKPNLFKIGMKMEAVDLYQSHIVKPATVVAIAGHLVKLHFDRHPVTPTMILPSFQWVDNESPDIYPIGWAEMVGHRFYGKPTPVGTL